MLSEAMDSCDSSSQQGLALSTASSSDSSSREPANLPRSLSATFVCLWKNCSQSGEDATIFYNHLQDHSFENMAGPCQWLDCKAARERIFRHQPRFMEHHIMQHIPRNAFRCLMDGCNKCFDRPDKLNNHLSKHPQPKKNEKPVFKLDDPTAGRIREVPIDGAAYGGGYEKVRKKLESQEVLRALGISFVSLSNEYYVSVHGLPEGDIVRTADGFEQKYRLHFPYAPHWIKEVHMRCSLDTPETPSSIILWKLPLSNPLFRDQLRCFVKEVEKEMSTRPRMVTW